MIIADDSQTVDAIDGALGLQRMGHGDSASWTAWYLLVVDEFVLLGPAFIKKVELQPR